MLKHLIGKQGRSSCRDRQARYLNPVAGARSGDNVVSDATIFGAGQSFLPTARLSRDISLLAVLGCSSLQVFFLLRWPHSTGGLQKGYGVESWQIAASEISTWVADERGKTEEMEGAERQRLFNRIAPMYDNLNDWLSLGQHKVWKRMAVAWSGAKEGDSVADICCGSGDIAFLLADRVGPRGKVSGLDFAKEQLEIASQRQGDCHIASSRMEWIQGDALNLPFDDASVDAITMGYGLRNVTNIPQALHEVYRVLKPGSKASILDFNHSENPFTSSFQEWVLGSIVVPIATQFSVEEEYAYLKTSIACFPTGVKLEVLARQAGFSTAVHYEIAGGLMGVLVATR